MNSKEIIEIVILYKPDISNFLLNLKSYIPSIDKIVIWMNSNISTSDMNKIMSIEFSEKIIFLGDMNNYGIAYPINQVIKKYKNNYT